MQVQPVAETWVCEQGYEWNGDHMMPAGGDVRVYNPFADAPAMFLVFANTLPTKAGILGFANKFGALEKRTVQHVGTLASWQEAIARMRAAVELWKAVRSTDKVALEKYVRWIDGRLSVDQPVVQDLQLSFRWNDPPYQKTHNVLEAATSILDTTASEMTRNVLSPRPVRLLDQPPRFQAEIEHLKDALAVQFALAVVEGKKYRPCAACGLPFELLPGENRADRQTCDSACRSKLYRRRKALARKLRAQGSHLREIATTIGSDMKTVKGWLKEGKQK